METKTNDQYVVKVAWSGRLTLRNRRFLRKYDTHYKHRPEWNFVPPGVEFKEYPIGASGQTTVMPVSQTTPKNPQSHVATPLPCTEVNQILPPPMDSTGEVPRKHQLLSDSEVRSPRKCSTAPQRLLFGTCPVDQSDSTSPTFNASPVVPVEFSPSTRPSRTRHARKLNDAATGTYTAPSPVPENV